MDLSNSPIMDQLVNAFKGPVLDQHVITKLIKELVKDIVEPDILSAIQVVWGSHIYTRSEDSKQSYKTYFSYPGVKFHKPGSILIIFSQMRHRDQIIDNIKCVIASLVVYNNISKIGPTIDGEKLARCLSTSLFGHDTFEGSEVEIFYFTERDYYWVNGKKKETIVVMEGDGKVVLEIEEGYIAFQNFKN